MSGLQHTSPPSKGSRAILPKIDSVSSAKAPLKLPKLKSATTASESTPPKVRTLRPLKSEPRPAPQFARGRRTVKYQSLDAEAIKMLDPTNYRSSDMYHSSPTKPLSSPSEEYTMNIRPCTPPEELLPSPPAPLIPSPPAPLDTPRSTMLASPRSPSRHSRSSRSNSVSPHSCHSGSSLTMDTFMQLPEIRSPSRGASPVPGEWLVAPLSANDPGRQRSLSPLSPRSISSRDSYSSEDLDELDRSITRLSALAGTPNRRTSTVSQGGKRRDKVRQRCEILAKAEKTTTFRAYVRADGKVYPIVKIWEGDGVEQVRDPVTGDIELVEGTPQKMYELKVANAAGTTFNGAELELIGDTGVVDKSGHMIYNGDVLRNRDGVIKFVLWNSEVNQWWVKKRDDHHDLGRALDQHNHKVVEAVVIGNMFERPQLMEGCKHFLPILAPALAPLAL